MEFADEQAQRIKEQNHRRIRRLVTCVAVFLIVLAVIMVAFTLRLGSTIDKLVSEAAKAGELSSVGNLSHSLADQLAQPTYGGKSGG